MATTKGILREKQMKIWNLKMLEESLFQSKDSGRAYTVRQVLDLISPNWKEAENFRDLEVNLK